MERLPESFSEPRHPEDKEANMKMVEVVLSSTGERTVILKARRDIATFEQLGFDYGDKVAQAAFDDSSWTAFGAFHKSLNLFKRFISFRINLLFIRVQLCSWFFILNLF